jgi:small-conductance mechanosensitive channel
MDIFTDLKNQFVTYYDAIIIILPKALIGLVLSGIFLFFMGFLRRKIIKFARIKAEDDLLVNFFDSVIRISIIVLSILLFLYVVGLSALAGTALGAVGVSTFIIGFAFKDIAENFLAGVIMAFKRPFRIGDYVKTLDVEGSIIEMSLRDTHIKTSDGKDVYVPNGQILKNPLYNYTIDGFLRGSFMVGVDYDSDTDLARKIILKEINKIPGILKDDKPARTHVKNLNINTVDIEVHYWINTFDKSYSGLELKSIAQSKVVTALSKANISMPANVVELKNYGAGLSLQSSKTNEN